MATQVKPQRCHASRGKAVGKASEEAAFIASDATAVYQDYNRTRRVMRDHESPGQPESVETTKRY